MSKPRQFRTKKELIKAHAEAHNLSLAQSSGLVIERSRMGFSYWAIQVEPNLPYSPALWGHTK